MKNLFLSLLCGAVLCLGAAAQRQTENVVLITLDGARYQEMFGGLDAELYRKIDDEAEKREVYRTYALPTAAARREKLMPFFWGVWMKNHGSIAGNPSLKSAALTTNKMYFSYPGYSEILTGEAHDDVIRSNDFVQNRFPSVLQFLQKKLKLDANRVASFASWNVMNAIATSEPDAFLVNAGYENYKSDDPQIQLLNIAQTQAPTPWDSVRHDFYTFRFAMAHLKKYRPRVLHIGLGEIDDWAHNKRYDLMIETFRRNDEYFKELWEFLESDEQYKGKTTVVVTTDHGRGPDEKSWDSHGEKVPEARNIWIAFVSPDSDRRGEWKDAPPVYQNQVAATLAKSLGFDYVEQNPNAGKPIAAVFSK